MPARGQSHRFGICACACATMFASIMQCTHQLVIPTRSLVVHLCIWTASVDRRSLSFRREASSGRSGRRPGAEAQQDDQLGRHQRHRRLPLLQLARPRGLRATQHTATPLTSPKYSTYQDCHRGRGRYLFEVFFLKIEAKY